MKKKMFSRVMAGICMTALLLSNSIEAFAAPAFINPTADVSVGSDRTLNITAGKDRDLFSNMKGLMPGDVRSNSVSINNNSSQALVFYLKAYPNYEAVNGDTHSAVRDGNKVTVDNKEFNDELLALIGMKITLDGKLIFDGKADGSPDLTEGAYGISLGEIPAKASKNLVVEITLPGPEMNNQFMDAFTAVDWVFIAEGKDSGGGNNNGDDDNGSGGGGNRPGGDTDNGPGVQVVTIDDGDVPLGTMGDSDVNIEIVDGQVPLASLAKTGGSLFHFGSLGLGLVVLLGAFAVVERKKKSYRSK